MKIVDFNSYPQEVIDRTNEFIESLNFTDAFSLIETTEELVKDCLAEKILNHWIGEGDLEISEDDFTKAIIKAEVLYALNDLKEQGAIAEIDDDRVVITEKGRNVANSLPK
jgi:hypothetical protein